MKNSQTLESSSQTEGLNFVDLFCGCGGLSFGLEMAGHRCLLGVDSDNHALSSFRLNHPQSQIYEGDIRHLSTSKLKELLGDQQVDMVVGGPPCQGFSTVGRGRVDDERNQLFKEFVRIVKVLSPKIIIFENVTGLVAKKNEKILAQIFRYFEKLGFNMDARVLSAEDYGVPERRRRTIIMGVQRAKCEFPQKTHGPERDLPYRTVSDAFLEIDSFKGDLTNHDKKTAFIKNRQDSLRIKHIPPGSGVRYEGDELKFLPKKLRYDVNWSKLREKRFRQTRLQRLPLDAPSPTILTIRTTYYHPTEPRFLTAREAASCQSFPVDFKFHGSLTSTFRQIGNAVPPLLGKALGESVKTIKWNHPHLQSASQLQPSYKTSLKSQKKKKPKINPMEQLKDKNIFRYQDMSSK